MPRLRGAAPIESLDLARPGPDEVRVRVQAVAICHSDVAQADGAWGGELPAVYGHEAAGVVEEVGRGTLLEVGQSVVVTLIRSCGECHRCRRGELVACTTRFALDEQSPLTTPDGRPVVHGLRCAAFAEQVVVHASQVVPIDSAIDPVPASLLACGVITGVGAVHQHRRRRAREHRRRDRVRWRRAQRAARRPAGRRRRDRRRRRPTRQARARSPARGDARRQPGRRRHAPRWSTPPPAG